MMLFNAVAPISQPTASAILRAVHAIDASAQVQVDATCQQVWIDGRLSAQDAIAVLGKAGCEARFADDAFADHEQGGRTCCGSCG